MMEAAAKKRNIRSLWHFTRLDNFDSIARHGLLPRAVLEQRNFPVAFNDPNRYDGYKKANCVSISYPNYKMFYLLRDKNPDTKWMVISIKPEILWLKDCAFIPTNASSRQMRNLLLDEHKGVDAFEKMFAEISGVPSRIKQRRKPRDTTDPQAEVLVLDTIEPSFINGYVVESPAVQLQLEQAHPDLNIICDKAHFAPRKNFRNW